MDYSHDFATRDIGTSIPALSSTALPNLLKMMDCLCSSLPPIPGKPRPLLKEENLFTKLIQQNIADKGENAEVYRLSEVLVYICEQLKLGPKEGDPTGTPPTPLGDRSPSLPINPFPEDLDQTKPPLTQHTPETEPAIVGQLNRQEVGNPGSLPDPVSKSKAPQTPTLPNKGSKGKNSQTGRNSMEVDGQVDSGINNDNNNSKDEAEPKDSTSCKWKSDLKQDSGPTPKRQKPEQFLEGITL